MQSDQNKIQFLNQLEQSLESIKQTKLRMEKKEAEQRAKRDALRETYQELLDKQRLYYRTVKDFQEVSRALKLLGWQSISVSTGSQTPINALFLFRNAGRTKSDSPF